MQFKREDGIGKALCYENQRVDAKGGNICILKGRMDKRGHYDVQIKRWMQKGAL